MRQQYQPLGIVVLRVGRLEAVSRQIVVECRQAGVGMTPGIYLNLRQAQARQFEGHRVEPDGGVEEDLAILFTQRLDPLRETLRSADENVRFRPGPRGLGVGLIRQRKHDEFEPFAIE